MKKKNWILEREIKKTKTLNPYKMKRKHTNMFQFAIESD